jgi:hypothetical protein
MTESSPGTHNPFEVAGHTSTPASRDQPVPTRRISVPLPMDDGEVKSFELPAALDDPTQFSAGELERLTRLYAEALRLLAPER